MSNKFSNPLKALKYRNFRLYWFGMMISQTGTWMQNIAQPWLALEVTNNATLVGIVAAVQFLPLLVFSLFSGALLDKSDKKFILKITQTGMCLTSLAFGLSIIFGFVNYPLILVLAFLTGLFNCLDAPCRQSFLYELIDDKKDVANAVALNSMSVNAARIMGPFFAGIVMAKFGLVACFFLNSASFIAIFISLFFIKNRPSKTNRRKESILKSIISGFHYIKKREILISPLVVILITGTFIPNYNVTISALAKYALGSGEDTFAYLMAFLGSGAFLGALWVAFTSKNISYKTVKIMPFVASTFLILVGLSNTIFLAGVFLAMTGFSFIICVSTINSLLQLNSIEAYRGRVMSVYSLFFLGSTPIGAITAGFLANEFGAGTSLVICGSIVYVLLVFWWVFKTFYLRFR
ncbi:transmembrane secretion effector, major facilitator superfamily [Campylobacter hyointestinalis subsp. hyointestinalis LMG 9260]|uniref:MFS transporter n=1 Tax=Campylobacter hyointestinalis TaxID=198 RepID=UPI0004D96DA0|nr:MFS transporter [Campylobacter hyointestinalis]ANE33391.1 transmembrane secretion effector, major facilitator superfamily [Campylobacter hyointestinalis subsp. hyointestinalis LMG 9260]KEA44022.1 major facilitator transporter [Campylobacter hyointestinalis subsp. hyointestinalis]QKF56561.1 transmembrane secretion effector, major facilitator superfamily [Campylobacter hyointestinalis subsp. hyointestinalis]TWO30588.1 MFS transporter [Campylobacter hyointestinalis]TXK47882.1 MFS transporter [